MLRKNYFLFLLSLYALRTAFVHAQYKDSTQNPTLARQQYGTVLLPLTFTKSPSIFQFICGIGIPVQDLETEIITTGMVFKGTYHLPKHIHDFTKHNINGRKSKSYEHHKTKNGSEAIHILEVEQNDGNGLSKYRWMFYRALELLSQTHGYAGRSCVLKAICEAAEIPFHDNGILNEVAHILLRPSTSNDALNSEKDKEYLYAEYLGRTGANCSARFLECKKSVLEQFSYIF